MKYRAAKPLDLARQHDASWMVSGGCRGSLCDFVPDSKQDAQPALAECRGSSCPVRSQCMAYAVDTRAYGVWGGAYLVWGQVKAA